MNATTGNSTEAAPMNATTGNSTEAAPMNATTGEDTVMMACVPVD